MARAVWTGRLLAESGDTIVVEGNHYFPKKSIRWEFFESSDTHTTCPWKGQASYYSIRVGGEVNNDAAWSYPSPSPEARQRGLKDRIAF